MRLIISLYYHYLTTSRRNSQKKNTHKQTLIFTNKIKQPNITVSISAFVCVLAVCQSVVHNNSPYNFKKRLRKIGEITKIAQLTQLKQLSRNENIRPESTIQTRSKQPCLDRLMTSPQPDGKMKNKYY